MTAVSRLSASVIDELPQAVIVPTYNRTHFKSTIIHVGPGNFHRAHQGYYLDALRHSGDLNWGMRGVGILPGDAPLLDNLTSQDCLYTIRETATDGTVTHRVSGAIAEVNRPGDSSQVLDWLSDPTTKIVTLTVTEGGYFIDPATADFRDEDPAIALEWSSHEPRNIFGYLVRALARRKEAGTLPFTLLSCDNLLGNGVAARKALIGFAKAWDPALAAWLDDNVATPSSMVDGITPAATPTDRHAVAAALGVQDACVVTCEPFRQWVIEDDFPGGRPRWEDVGVQLVPDVSPYEHMKLRMLNAAHQTMAYLGALAGFSYIHDVCLDDDIGGLLEVFWRDEAQPMCPQVPAIDLDEYRRTLRSRFSNPGIADTVARNAAQSSDRIPGFVLPTVADNLAAGGPIDAGALVVAAWAKYLQGRDEHGRELIPVDDRLHDLVPLVQRSPELPLELLGHPQLATVGTHPRFRESFADAFTALRTGGAQAAARSVIRRRNQL